jgi:hypothetical protein
MVAEKTMAPYQLKTVLKQAEEIVPPLISDISDDGLQDEAEHGTSCYLCYAQCSNFGNHGKSVRPCAKGFTDLIEHRRSLRRIRSTTLK